MKTKTLFMVLIVLATFSSCGGNKKSNSEELQARRDKTVELKPYDTKVKGYLSNVLEVVDGTYSLSYKAEFPSPTTIQVKIKSIAKGNANDYGLQDKNDGPLVMTICNKDGVPVANFPEIQSNYKSDGLLKDMMSKCDENWILFDRSAYHDVLPDDCATFIITSKETKKSSDSNDDEDSSDFSDTGDKKWDKMLDDYEAYVDKYLSMIKKMNKDDSLDALLDYPDLLEKAKKLEKSLEEAKTSKSLSSKQVKRMAEVQVKMINAMSDMNDNN